MHSVPLTISRWFIVQFILHFVRHLNKDDFCTIKRVSSKNQPNFCSEFNLNRDNLLPQGEVFFKRGCFRMIPILLKNRSKFLSTRNIEKNIINHSQVKQHLDKLTHRLSIR